MPNNSQTQVRFAPSPTGKVHIGNIRTAIFNWLYARHTNGKFLIRVEDTDIERSTAEAIEKLFECLEWLNIDYDEKPVYQTANASIHKEAATKLLKESKAYYPAVAQDKQAPLIFRIPWDTDDMPEVRIAGEAKVTLHPDELVIISGSGLSFAQISKKGKPIPTTACLAGFHGLKVFDSEDNCIFDIDQHIDSILTGFKTFELSNATTLSFERRVVQFEDAVKGFLSKPLDSIKDFVIVRSDGSPIFHLANVIDDANQQISCIIRGDDHVENTYRHIFLFKALGYKIPQYAHLPMIVNQTGKPYSKRDGDAFVGDFKLKGFLPDALFNYLALLGWSPGNDKEKMTMRELAESFSLDRVLSSPAQFDMNKLTNLNSKYIAELSDSKFIEKILDYAKLTSQTDILAWYQNNKETFKTVASLMKERTKLFADVASWKIFFANELIYDVKILKKHVKQTFLDFLSELINDLKTLEIFSPQKIECALRAFEEKHDLSQGKINRPLRVAVTALPSGPDLIEILSIFGKQLVIERLEKLQKKMMEQ